MNENLTAFQRRYVSMIKRCDELERKLKYFGAEIDKCGLTMQSGGSCDEFLRDSTEVGAGGEHARTGAALLEHMERVLEQHEAHLKEVHTWFFYVCGGGGGRF